MKKVKMGTKFLTGLSRLDEQHERILYLLEYSIESLKIKDNLEQRLQVITSECDKYIKYHLGYEEQLMIDMDYDDLEKHLTQHHIFRSKLEELNRCPQDFEEKFRDISTFIYTWFINHIPNYDFKLAQYIKERSIDQLQKAFPQNFIPVFLYDNGSRIPALIIGQSPILHNKKELIHFLENDNDKTEYYQAIRTSLQKTDNIEEENYHPLPYGVFSDTNYFPFDIYIHNEQFKRIHKKEETFYLSKILDLSDNKKRTFYVKKDVLQELIDFTFRNTELEIDKQFDDVFYQDNDLVDIKKEKLPDGLKKLGIQLNSYVMTFTSFENIKIRIKQSINLTKYFNQIFQNNKTYLYKQNILLCFLGIEFLSRIKEEDLNEKIDQWIFASLFHDLVLANDPLVMIRNNWQLQIADISNKDKETVIHHGELALKIVDECANVPKGARTLILQHHGSNIGYGFPKTLSMELSDIVIQFKIIEDFIYQYIYHRAPIKRIIKNFNNFYHHPRYQKSLECLNSILFNKPINNKP